MRGVVMHAPGDVRVEEVFDLLLPLAEAAAGDGAMDEGRATKVLLPQ